MRSIGFPLENFYEDSYSFWLHHESQLVDGYEQILSRNIEPLENQNFN